MALVSEKYGCKIGWATYDNEDEAKARAELEAERRERKFEQGYDFGYSWPGSISRNERDGVETWTVIVA